MRRVGMLMGLAALALAGAAWAEEGERPLRLIGETPAAKGSIPKRFVIVGVLKDTGEALRADVEGWFAALPPDMNAGEIEGSCVEERCALTVDLDEGKLVLSGDLAGKAPASVKLVAQDYDDKPVGQAQASLTAFQNDVPGLGRLAADGAIGAQALSDLLVWAGRDLGFTNDNDDEPIGDREREALADWQAGKERPATGLLTETDLAALKAEAEAAKKAAGWTELSGQGWKVGYPAALLPRASGGGRERRFSSADGKASLVIGFDAPMSDEAWDAFIDRETEDRADIDGRSYTRVNDDFEIRWVAKGVVTAAAYHRRDGGLVKAVLVYPEDAEALVPFETILPRTFRVEDEVKAP